MYKPKGLEIKNPIAIVIPNEVCKSILPNAGRNELKNDRYFFFISIFIDIYIYRCINIYIYVYEISSIKLIYYDSGNMYWGTRQLYVAIKLK